MSCSVSRRLCLVRLPHSREPKRARPCSSGPGQWCEAWHLLGAPREQRLCCVLSAWRPLEHRAFAGSAAPCGVPKLDRALERGGLPLSRGRSLPALLGTRGVHASVGFERLLAARTLAASAPDRIKAPHRLAPSHPHRRVRGVRPVCGPLTPF